MSGDEIPPSTKLVSLYRVARFRPLFTVSLIFLSVFAALFEGAGLSFLLPIIEFAQAGSGPPNSADGLLRLFFRAYRLLGIPFTLFYLVLGVAAVMIVRFTMSFLIGWFRGAIQTKYVRYLQAEGFERALDARVEYFDEEGSDDILNAIVTQSEQAGRVIERTIRVIEHSLLSLMYFAIALYMAPRLAVLTALFLGGVSLVFRNTLEGGYSVGDRVAEANERIQEAAQAGTTGIRDVKLFGMRSELLEQFRSSVKEFERSQIKLFRNQSAIENFYRLLTAVSVFVLIYVALAFRSLSVGELGVFLFAMFRLGPRVSNLNKMLYLTEGQLPHLVRTQQFLNQLEDSEERQPHGDPVPERIETVEFKNVSFKYGTGDEPVLRDVSFSVERGGFVGFAGPSGAGKSTIVSLLARLYEPDEGTITCNDRPISELELQEWRSRIAVVRQDPHIFDDTLWRNITIGKRGASDAEVRRVCEIAQIDEFLDDLPDGYDTPLGDDGVKLSGGQRQRVAIARALLKDAEVLVLDEATSNLDTSLEDRVQRSIEQLDRDYIMIVIAHRLSTILNADRIYTMKHGRIVETGSHDELLRQGGEYSDLYQGQTEPEPAEQ